MLEVASPESGHRRSPFTLAEIGLVVLLALAGSALLVAGLAGVEYWTHWLARHRTSEVVLAIAASFYLAFGGALVLVVRRHRDPRADLRLQPLMPGGVRTILFAIPAWLLGLVLVSAITAAVFNRGRPVPSNTAEVFRGPPSVAALALALVVFAGLAPVCEEAFFRGMLYQYLRARLPLAAAVGLSAALFAALHAIPLLFPVLFFMGSMLAIIFEGSRSLYASVGFHAANNALAVALVYAQLTAR